MRGGLGSLAHLDPLDYAFARMPGFTSSLARPRNAWLLIALLACGQEAPPRSERPDQDVMRGAPIYLPSRAVEERTTATAAETEFRSPDPVQRVADWYRDRVDAMGWNLIGDAPSADSGVVLHVERDGPPLWIVIRPAPNGEGTIFSLIGAAPRESGTTDPSP